MAQRRVVTLLPGALLVNSAVHVSSMRDARHRHDTCLVVDLKDHSVIAYSDAVEPWATLDRFDA